jgi:hypothetical protein
VLNLVSVELFVFLVNRREQAIASVLVRSKRERQKQQASDDPQDARRDRQTRTNNCLVSILKYSCSSLSIQERIFEVASTRVIHVAVTRSPTDAWAAQQLREATLYGQTPKYLLCDNDSKFGSSFARVAATSAIEILKTPYHPLRANAICERFLRSMRQECLDHLLILHERQLQRVLNAYVAYFNQARPHQGIQQQIPASSGSSGSTQHEGTRVVAVPILAGLHHDY